MCDTRLVLGASVARGPSKFGRCNYLRSCSEDMMQATLVLFSELSLLVAHSGSRWHCSQQARALSETESLVLYTC